MKQKKKKKRKKILKKEKGKQHCDVPVAVGPSARQTTINYTIDSTILGYCCVLTM